MGTEVKYFHSGMAGAPVLNGVAGAMAALLDALLVDGFDTKSITSGSITDGIATINWSGSFSGEVDSVVVNAGLTPSSLNGEKRVLSKTATSLTFATTEANGSITVGSGTTKMAPLGWTKPYTGTNKRAYKIVDVAGTGFYLRLDDAGTNTCRVYGHETMSDVDTGTGRFPTDAQVSGGYYWPKSSTADSTARSWEVVGDSRLFHIIVHPNATNPTQGYASTFGDILPVSSADNYACLMAGSGVSTVTTEASSSNTSACMGFSQGVTHQISQFMARSFSGVGGPQSCAQVSGMAAANGYSATTNYAPRAFPWPNSADNGLIVSPVVCQQASPWTYRGTIPGFYHTSLAVSGVSNRDKFPGVGAYSGRVMTAIRVGTPGSASPAGMAFVDITGPWR